jgi:hypothetical protein
MSTTDKRFDEALAENMEKITGSVVFVQMYHPSMADFEKDPWPAIQLAIAILQDKPIIIACPPGRQLPERLRRLADAVVRGGPEEVTAAVQRLADAR